MSVTLHALVLAAGRGVRMRPLSEDRAKPALPVLGTSLVGRILRELRGQGVTAAAVNAYHGAEGLASALERDAGGGVELFREAVLMGTGGALDAPRRLLAGSDPFLLHNGDTLVHAPVARLVAAASEPGRLGALLVRLPAVEGYTPLAVRGGRLTGIGRDAIVPGESGSATYLGVAALRRRVLDQVPEERPSELFDDVLLPMMEEDGGELAVVPYEGRWLEFTSPPSYHRMLLDLAREASRERGLRLPGGTVEVIPRGPGWLFAAPGAEWDDAAIAGSAVVESGARIDPGCRLEDALLLEGARVMRDCVIRRSIVGRGARVPPGTRLEDEIALPGGADGAPRRMPLAADGDAR
jgi:NDP-sugar pyrophosphorylase family protein